ncbi:hypothetical protein JCM5296_004481 [Sporobolomyces johnsonii]
MPRGSKVAEGEEPLSRQSLKAAVWYTVTKIAQEEELSLPFAASEHFVATLAEVVFQQALSLGTDLEAYAKHAGRMMINVDDVKLAARRNEPLYDLLCTAATTHGLALADLKADRKPKLKAPRVAATTKAKAATTTTGSSKAAANANAEKMNEGDEPAPAKKAKTKSKSVPVPVPAPAAAGFVSAKEELAAKKKEKEKAGKGKKRKAVSDDEEEEEGDDPRGGDARVSDAEEEEDEEEGDRDEELASDESEDVGAKRKGKGARGKRGG